MLCVRPRAPTGAWACACGMLCPWCGAFAKELRARSPLLRDFANFLAKGEAGECENAACATRALFGGPKLARVKPAGEAPSDLALRGRGETMDPSGNCSSSYTGGACRAAPGTPDCRRTGPSDCRSTGPLRPAAWPSRRPGAPECWA